MRFILTADWHLREDLPRCRVDKDWIQVQKNALGQILSICRQKNCSLYVVGDIFHRSSEFRMVRMVQSLADELEKTDLRLYYLAGNHDLKYHSSLNLDSSAIGLLRSSNNCRFIKDNPFENLDAPNFDEEPKYVGEVDYLFLHTLCFPDMKSVPPNVNATFARELLEDYPHPKWIFTGDYHGNFHYEWNGRHVVNSGCLLRQAVDMKDHQCGVYYIDTDTEEVEFIPIKDDVELVDDSYIIEEKERDERIESFVDKLRQTDLVTLDYLENVEKALLNDSISDEVKEVVRELLEV